MKTRLNLTIEEELLKQVKFYARKRHVSVSELVEIHFQSLTRPKRPINIIDIIANLEKPAIADNADLKELYYKEHGRS